MSRSEITVEIDGQTFSGSYEVARGIITVSTAYGRKSTQVGSTPPDTLARILLRELVQAEKGRKDSMI
ncbi:MAG TPA: hypothetical protein VNT52_17270 [Acidimicrobiales bacterium]|nr:hypothetical protein [Acidimicrobiales bacterium]